MSIASETSNTNATPRDWVRFYARLAGLSTLLISIVAATNYLINPIGIYPTHIMPAADRMARVWKIKLLRESEIKPQVLILGGSNTMKIDPREVEVVTGISTFNAATDVSMGEDYYAYTRYATEQAGANLRLLLLGIDVDAFHTSRPADIRFIMSPELRGYAGISDTSARWNAFKYLFDWSQSSLSIYALTAQLHGAEAKAKFDPNGYLSVGSWDESIRKGTFDLAANVKGSVSEFEERFNGYTYLSPQRVRYLEETVKYCAMHGIAVIIFIPPLHPDVISGVASYSALHTELVAEATKLTNEYHVTFYDYSDPRSFGGSPLYFYDGGHMDQRNAKLLVDALFRCEENGRVANCSKGKR